MRIEAEPIKPSWQPYTQKFLANAHAEQRKREKFRQSWRRGVLWYQRQVLEKKRKFRLSWQVMIREAAKQQKARIESNVRKQIAELEMELGREIQPKKFMADTLEQYCASMGVSAEELRGRYRNRLLVRKRHQLYSILRKEHPEKSLPEIGRFMNRDHTSILNGIRRHAERMQKGDA